MEPSKIFNTARKPKMRFPAVIKLGSRKILPGLGDEVGGGFMGISRPAGDGSGGASHAIAGLHQHGAFQGKEDFGTRTEADHAEAEAALESIAFLRPRHDTARDQAGDLADGD